MRNILEQRKSIKSQSRTGCYFIRIESGPRSIEDTSEAYFLYADSKAPKFSDVSPEKRVFVLIFAFIIDSLEDFGLRRIARECLRYRATRLPERLETGIDCSNRMPLERNFWIWICLRGRPATSGRHH